ncbi:MAG: DUF2061 domain-containing protein [Ectothiorhodospiraceae bacterium]|nr:DUF2061 domain-containing protein [Ectothiorhodospiraceae bacterium]
MAKTVSFAITHFTVAFSVAYALTGDLAVGGAVALIEPAVNTVAYHLHEKVWARRAGGCVTRAVTTPCCAATALLTARPRPGSPAGHAA